MVVQYIEAVLPQDVAGAQLGDHTEQAELPHMEDGGCGQSAGKEVDRRGGGAWVQTLEPL